MTSMSPFERTLEEWLRAAAPPTAPREVLALALDRVALRGQDRYVNQRIFGDRVGRSGTLRFVALTAITALLVVALAVSTFAKAIAGLFPL